MQIVYHANNSIDGHIIKNLLIQAGINAHLHGEHLQSGAGHLQAFGTVKVWVDSADANQALALINRFQHNTIDAAQATDAPADNALADHSTPDEQTSSPEMLWILLAVFVLLFVVGKIIIEH